MQSFEVHSNESSCRNSGCLGLEQVFKGIHIICIPLIKLASKQVNSSHRNLISYHGTKLFYHIETQKKPHK